MYHTFISKKQIGVLYSNWKRGFIAMTEEQVKWLYNDIAEVRGYINNNNFEDVLRRVKNAIDAVFGGNMEEAQQSIEAAWNKYTACFG